MDDDDPKPESVEYRGALVTRYVVGGFYAYVCFPGTPLHGFASNRQHVKDMIDWWVDTGGDQARLQNTDEPWGKYCYKRFKG